MSERRNSTRHLSASSDADLEALLHQLGQSIAWPTADDLAARVRDRLGEGQPSGAVPPAARGRSLRIRGFGARGLGWSLPRSRLRRAVFLAVAAVVLVATVAVALRLGLPGIGITFGPLPAVTPTESPAPVGSPPSGLAPSPGPSVGASPASVGAALELGRLVTLDEAQAAVDWTVAQPSLDGLRAPAEIWLDGSGHTALVSFVWGAGTDRPAVPGSNVGLLLTQFRGSVRGDRLEKTLGPSSRVVPVIVDRERGFWIEGALHTVSYAVEGDGPGQDRVRLAGNVLIWTRDGLTLRLETAADKARALEVAASVR